MALDPKNADAHNNFGIALRETGRLTDAIAEFERAIQIDPGMAAAHLNLALTLSFSGREFYQIMTADATESITDKSSIGDLARELDVTPRAIRFYEDEGLLSPGRDGSRRVYSKRDYVRLKLILRGKRLGFSLAEVREMLELYDSAPDERPQLEKFVAALAARREQLERQREEIDEVLQEIRGFERQSKKLLNARGAKRR